MKTRDVRVISEDSGFTLPEIIVSIVLMGILGAMAAQFMASVLEGTTLPIDHVQAEAGRVSIMEKITSDYVIALNSNTPLTALSTIATNVGNGDYNTADTTVTTDWIAFNSGLETAVTPGPSDNLKVSVTTGNAVIVTILSTSRTDASDPKVNF